MEEKRCDNCSYNPRCELYQGGQTVACATHKEQVRGQG